MFVLRNLSNASFFPALKLLPITPAISHTAAFLSDNVLHMCKVIVITAYVEY